MRMKMKVLQWMMVLAFVGFVVGGCQMGESALDVRTFELEYLEPNAAASLIDPYVYGNRDRNPGMLNIGPGSITVRERPDNLDRIAEVLERFDKPKPGVTLHFQLIEADGAAGRDPAIADVEAELRKVFQYDGYRLIGEGVLRGLEGATLAQRIATERGDYLIEVDLERVRQEGQGGTIQMELELHSDEGPNLGTGLSISLAPEQTGIVGSARPSMQRGALILTVQASFGDNG